MDEPSKPPHETDFEAEIRSQAAYWQKLLALQDWNIDIRVTRQWDMSDSTTLAQCKWYLHRKDAVIQVLSPLDLEGLESKFIKGEESDYDISLVHELLHLHFAPLNIGEPDRHYDIAEEQAINAISRGIVKLYRSTPPTEDKPVPNHGHYI